MKFLKSNFYESYLNSSFIFETSMTADKSSSFNRSSIDNALS